MKNLFHNRPHLWLSLVCIVFLSIAAIDPGTHRTRGRMRRQGLPYGYFQFMRWVVCAGAGISAWMLFVADKTAPGVITAAIAVLFNPIIPIHLNRPIWQALDIAAALILLVIGIAIRLPELNDP